jgi:hypothetical protein
VERLGQLAVGLEGQGIFLLGPIQGDVADAVVDAPTEVFGIDVGIGHGFLRVSRVSF